MESSRKISAAAEDPAALAPEMPFPPNPMVSPAPGAVAPEGAPPYPILNSPPYNYAYYYPYGYTYAHPPSGTLAASLPIPAQVSETTGVQSARLSSVPTAKAAENQRSSSKCEQSKKSGYGNITPSSTSENTVSEDDGATLHAAGDIAQDSRQGERLEENCSQVHSVDGESLSDPSVDGECLSDCQSSEGGNGPGRNDDAASLITTPSAAGGISARSMVLESRELDAAPIDICNSALSSRAVSPILTTADASGTCTASKRRSPNVASRAADRMFPDDTGGGEVADTKPVREVKTEDASVATEPGGMMHLDEPKKYAWIRPRIAMIQPGDPMMVLNGDGDVPQLYPAFPCSYPAPSNEIWEGIHDGDWQVYIKWDTSGSKQWVLCEQCRQISSLGRGSQRIRKEPIRFGSRSKADLKKLMQHSKRTFGDGSKEKPIEIHDACGESKDSVSPIYVSRAPKRAIGDRAARRSARVGHTTDRLVDHKNEPPQHKSKCISEGQDFGQPQQRQVSSASASSFVKRKGRYHVHGDECESYHQQLADRWKAKKRRKPSLCAAARKVSPSAVKANGTDGSVENKATNQSTALLQTNSVHDMQARIEELEEHNQALLRELQRFQRLHGSEEPSSRPRRRLRVTRSSGDTSTAHSKQRQQPKRSATNDIYTRRNLLLSVTFVNDDRQSDPNGIGVIASRNISAGEVFYDRNVKYCEGKPPLNIDEWRYISVGTETASSGYFRLVDTFTEMINQPMLKGQVANIQWGTVLYEHESRRIIRWKVIHDIAKGEELFAEYRSFH